MFPLESVTVNTWLGLPARMTTAIKFPPVLLEVKASEEELVRPASLLVC